MDKLAINWQNFALVGLPTQFLPRQKFFNRSVLTVNIFKNELPKIQAHFCSFYG